VLSAGRGKGFTFGLGIRQPAHGSPGREKKTASRGPSAQAADGRWQRADGKRQRARVSPRASGEEKHAFAGRIASIVVAVGAAGRHPCAAAGGACQKAPTATAASCSVAPQRPRHNGDEGTCFSSSSFSQRCRVAARERLGLGSIAQRQVRLPPAHCAWPQASITSHVQCPMSNVSGRRRHMQPDTCQCQSSC
jgi:hypothetical protein